MDQRMLAAICRIIVGRNGRRLGPLDIKTAYTQSLFADYYQYSQWACRQTYYKYMNGSTPYPHFLGRHYAGANGYRRNLSDMMGIVDTCTSIVLLRQIQAEVYQWVITQLPANAISAVNSNYVSGVANRKQIAVYLADVMHYALNVDNLAYNPIGKISNL